MSSRITRRNFISRTSAIGLAGFATTNLARQAMGIEPLNRNGAAKFKFSLAAYSYRELFSNKPGGLTVSDFIDDCAKLNLEGTELTSYYFPTPITDDYLRELKRQCFLLGLDVSGTAIRCDFGMPPGAEREQQIEDVKKWIDRAEILGAPVIRIFAGLPRDGVSPDKLHSLMVAGIEECCEYAGKHGTILAIENHGGPTMTPEGMLSFIRDVDSPWFGVNLDTGNFHSEDPYADLARVAPYAVNVQVKVVTSDALRKNKKPADFARLARILRDAAYRGYIVLEFEEPGDPRVECPKYMEQIRAAFA